MKLIVEIAVYIAGGCFLATTLLILGAKFSRMAGEMSTIGHILVRWHRRFAFATIAAWFVAVGLADTYFRIILRETAYPPLFWWHLPFAAMTLGIMIVMFIFNGKRWPYFHRWCGRFTYASVPYTLTTGLLLLHRLP